MWQLTLGLIGSVAQAKVEAGTISHSPAISACEKRQMLDVTLGWISNMAQAKVEADTSSPAISACEIGQA